MRFLYTATLAALISGCASQPKVPTIALTQTSAGCHVATYDPALTLYTTFITPVTCDDMAQRLSGQKDVRVVRRIFPWSIK